MTVTPERVPLYMLVESLSPETYVEIFQGEGKTLFADKVGKLLADLDFYRTIDSRIIERLNLSGVFFGGCCGIWL